MPGHAAYMRAAVLLSLRDQFGAGLLPVFHAAGVTPLRQVSDALGMKPDELAAIWAHLPWDDRAIGRRLGITGLQVLNLRTAARSRLLRGDGPQGPGDDHRRAPVARPGPGLRPRRAAPVDAGHASTITSRTARPAAPPWPANPTRRSAPRRSAGRWPRPEARPESPHLAFEHLRGAVDGTLGAVDAEWVEAHIGLCMMCAEELRDLQRFAPFVPIKIAMPARRRPRRSWRRRRRSRAGAGATPVAATPRSAEADVRHRAATAYGAAPPARLPRWMPGGRRPVAAAARADVGLLTAARVRRSRCSSRLAASR